MKSFLPSVLGVAIGLAAASISHAQYQPVVANRVGDITVPVGTKTTVVKFKNTFALNSVTGPVVRFSTSAGTLDVELLADQCPQTVAAFEKYAFTSGDNTTGAVSYNNTLIQRAVANFIVQGGGYYIGQSGEIDQITGRPTIPGEPGVSNARGTLAMALSNGPDSGTGEWFFNVADNNIPDTQYNLDDTTDGGPFTVFGRVIQGVGTLDAIEALDDPQHDFSGQLGQGWENVPLINYDNVNKPQVQPSNLVYTHSITSLPLLPAHEGLPASLKLKLKGNTNPGLVKSAVIDGKKLTLNFKHGVTGTSTITIQAKDAAKNKATTAFTVTVE